MSHRIVRAGLAVFVMAGFALPTALNAQDQPERGEMAQVIQWKVQPDQAVDFEAGIAGIVEAAKAAGLEDYRWVFWNDLYTYTLVFPVADMAYFNDPDQWMYGIMGSEGEETLQAAFATLAPVQSSVVLNQIVETDLSISYQPEKAAAAPPMFAHVDIATIRSGQEEAFNAIVKEFMQFFSDIGYTYEIRGHRVKLGNTDRVDFVTFFDSKASYYGDNNMVERAKAAGMEEKLADLGTRLNATITDWMHFDQEPKPDMSYWPAADSE